ncbi:LacI family transcriptional regulator [Thioclava sp. SK-1]|nr:LacI family transcriptional regulator [Thioclava sp. SK-1]
MRRPTIADLANAAGVSVATVDRVLNGRMKVREETVRKVHDAARQVGYHGANMIRQRMLADRPEVRIGVVLPKPRHAFYQDVVKVFEDFAQASGGHSIQLQFKFTESTDPQELARVLTGFRGRVDAVAATGIDHHEVTAAVTDLRDADIPVFSLLSDFAQGVRESYFGMNNLKVGRLAAWSIAKMADKPGKIGLFIGSSRYHGHVLRETGFRSYLRDAAPDFSLIDTQINLETRQLTHEATIDLMERNPDLVGLYCAGGGMEGAISAVRQMRRPEEVILIVNEFTPESRAALQDGYVTMAIGTPLRLLVEDLMVLILMTVEKGMAETPGQKFLQPHIWTPETI